MLTQARSSGNYLTQRRRLSWSNLTELLGVWGQYSFLFYYLIYSGPRWRRWGSRDHPRYLPDICLWRGVLNTTILIEWNILSDYKPTSKAFVTPTTATALATLNFLFALLSMSAFFGVCGCEDWLGLPSRSPGLGLWRASPWLCLRNASAWLCFHDGNTDGSEKHLPDFIFPGRPV